MTRYALAVLDVAHPLAEFDPFPRPFLLILTTWSACHVQVNRAEAMAWHAHLPNLW